MQRFLVGFSRSQRQGAMTYMCRGYMGNTLKIERFLFYKLPVSPLSERNMFSRLCIMFEWSYNCIVSLGWRAMHWCFIRTQKIIKEKTKSKQHRSNLWMIPSHPRTVHEQTLLPPLCLLATVSVWQHLSFAWVKVKYPFCFEEESSIFTMHVS